MTPASVVPRHQVTAAALVVMPLALGRLLPGLPVDGFLHMVRQRPGRSRSRQHGLHALQRRKAQAGQLERQHGLLRIGQNGPQRPTCHAVKEPVRVPMVPVPRHLRPRKPHGVIGMPGVVAGQLHHLAEPDLSNPIVLMPAVHARRHKPLNALALRIAPCERQVIAGEDVAADLRRRPRDQALGRVLGIAPGLGLVLGFAVFGRGIRASQHLALQPAHEALGFR